MSIIAAHNLNALCINRNLSINNSRMATSLRNISTGYKINTGADDPSGLVISEQLRAQATGIERAIQNTQETNNMLGIAEGALSEVSNILNKMRQLAIHSANSGVTSEEQIAADQAELDSSIQTIDRIARTTKFSDQFLLNGNKAIGFDTYTQINSTQNNKLLDMDMSEITQVPANGSGLRVNFDGTDSSGDAAMANQARKAYFEVDGDDSRLDVANNAFTKDQFFTLSGNKGSRMLSFAKGTSFGDAVDTINSISDSTGAEASLIFSKNQSVDMIAYSTNANVVNSGLQTDLGGGVIPTFSSANVIQGGSASANINSADVTERFDIIVNQDAAGQLTLEMIDDDGRSAGSQVVNLNAQTVTGDYVQTIGAIDLGGGTFIPSFDIAYTYDSTGSAYNTITNTTLFHCDDDGLNVASNGATFTNSSGNPQNIVDGGLPATMTIGNGDRVGNSFSVRYDSASNGAVVFNVRDNSGQINTNINVNLAGDIDPTLGISDANVTLNFGSGSASQISFTYNFESDPDNSNPTENTPAQNVISVNGHTNATSILGATTTGPNSSTVTAPYQAVDATQNHDIRLNIYDVVNGETPLQVTSEAGSSPDEVVFVVTGSSSGELLRQSVSLAALATCGTGSQAISLQTPNGTSIDFDYFYENNPHSGLYDKPLGSLFTFSADPVDKDPVFDGLSSTAIAAGASLAFNLDPSDPDHLSNLEYGRNTDGQGRLFVKVIEHNTSSHQIKFELYKDENMNEATLVGSGSGLADGSDIRINAANSSNLTGTMSFDDAGGVVNLMDELSDKQTYLGVGGIWGTNGVSYSGGFALNASQSGVYDEGSTILSGIDLGKNTDNSGKLYIKTVQDGANSGQVFVYKDKAMREQDLVAMSETSQDLTADKSVIVNEVNGSGLGLILTTGTVDWDGANGTNHTAELSFDNLGIRVSASDYGSDQFLSIDQNEGQIWEYYSPGDTDNSRVVTATEGGVRLTGADAVVTINGAEKRCDGLSLDLATLDFAGHLKFAAGKVGSTTLAQVGYDVGSVFTNASFLEDTSDGWTDSNHDGKRDPDEIDSFKAGANLTTAGHNTMQYFEFDGGMQVQLGEGASSNNRTILGLSSITAIDLGKIRLGDDDDMFCLNDLLGGGSLSLREDPVKALDVIDAAIDDVSNMRASIGAWQSNLLQTNINSLNVALENIQKTESYLRDADIAKESTEFAKNQILVQVGTSMLAQANKMNQNNVLSLIGG